MNEKEISDTVNSLQRARTLISGGVCFHSITENDHLKRLKYQSYVAQGGVTLAQCLLKLEKCLLAEFPDMFTREDDIFGDAQKLLSRLFSDGIEGENELFERSKNLEEKFSMVAEKMADTT